MNKDQFHRLYLRLLKEIAEKHLLLLPGEYSIRSNKGGPAIPGEIILHTDTVYVQVGGSLSMGTVMYRSCEGQKDYVGGINRWMTTTTLTEDPSVAAALFKTAAEMSGREPRYGKG